MHKYKKNRGKFTFSAIFLVFGLRRVAVASRWDCPLGNVGALEGTTLPLYVRTKSAHTQAGEYIFTQNLPIVSPLYAIYLHWNLIGTSLESDWNLIGTSSNNYRYFKP